MGTRADFWVGRESQEGWIGSVAWDGYPDGITPQSEETESPWPGYVRHKDIKWPEGEHLLDATTEAQFRERVERYFQYRDDVTRPEHGWPWPWEDSCTTDYAYVFEEGRVQIYSFGQAVDRNEDEDPKGPKAKFPDMKAIQNVDFGKRSGLIILGG